MKNTRVFLSYLMLITTMLSCKQAPKEVMDPNEIVKARGYTISVYDFENFKALLEKNDDKIRVVNFWAT